MMRLRSAARGVCRAVVMAAACGLLVAAPAVAQRGGGRGGGGGRFPGGFDMSSLGDPNGFYTPPDFKGNPIYDGRFTFARIKYRGYGRWSRTEGPGWSHDYPDADVHFMKILREITSMRPFTDAGPIIGGAIVGFDEPELFKYPVAYLSEPGGWFPTPAEVTGLRNYILKGGFMIVDDFPPRDWGTFENAMNKAFPELKPVLMTGKEPIFDAFFKIDLKKIQRGAYGQGSFYAYYEKNDPKKRLLVIADYSQDVGDAWQWSGTGFMPIDVSNEAFKLGVNYVIYALTH